MFELLPWSYRPLAGASLPAHSTASAVKDTLRPEGQARGGGGSGANVGPSGEATVEATAGDVPSAHADDVIAGVSAEGAEAHAPIEAHVPGASGEQHPLSVPLWSTSPNGRPAEPNESDEAEATTGALAIAWCIPAGIAPAKAAVTFAWPLSVPQSAPPLTNESCRSSALESTAVMRRKSGSECTITSDWNDATAF